MKRILRAISLVALACLMFANIASADMPPKLKTAVEAWLDDRDDIALPLLSELAKAGNEDAMLFLGQLERRPGVLSDYLASLSPDEMRALIRSDEGRFGVSWLKKVEQQRELAQAFLHQTDPQERFKALGTLLKTNETGQAIRLILRELMIGGFNNLMLISQKYSFPKEVKSILWTAAFFAQGNSDNPDLKRHARMLLSREAIPAAMKRTMQGYLFTSHTATWLKSSDQFQYQIDIGYILSGGEFGSYLPPQSRVVFTPPKSWEEKLELNEAAAQIILQAQETWPIVRYCEKYCAQTVTMCVRTTFGAIGGYYGFLELQSPLEKLIPRQTYLQSKRFEADMVRFVGDRGQKMMRTHKDKVDTCAAQRLLSGKQAVE